MNQTNFVQWKFTKYKIQNHEKFSITKLRKIIIGANSKLKRACDKGNQTWENYKITYELLLHKYYTYIRNRINHETAMKWQLVIKKEEYQWEWMEVVFLKREEYHWEFMEVVEQIW